MVQVAGAANPGDFGRRFVHDVRQLTGHDVGVVHLSGGDEHIGFFQPGLYQNVGVGGVAVDGPDVETVLQSLKVGAVKVNDRDVIVFGGE